MKKCCTCKMKKETTEFNKHRGRKDGLAACCRTCANKSNNKFYKANTTKCIESARVVRKRKKPELEQKLFDYLTQHPCVDCGESNPVVLEFDHVHNKEFNICMGIKRQYVWSIIEVEIAKCEVRCANCHKIKTAKDFNWPKHRLNELQALESNQAGSL